MLFSAFKHGCYDRNSKPCAAPLPPRRAAATRMTRYYYSDDRLFEKSLDVYTPVTTADGTTLLRDGDSNMPAAAAAVLVLLVVGSGWMGHHWSIYRLTAWWNASGPQTIASCGTICICIRHRGAFFKVPPLLPAALHWFTAVVVLARQNRPAFIVGVLLLLMTTAAIAIGGCSSSSSSSSSATACVQLIQQAATIIASALFAFLGCWGFMAAASRGSAELDDMVHDVAQAVAWVERNKDKLLLLASSGHRGGDSNCAVSNIIRECDNYQYYYGC